MMAYNPNGLKYDTLLRSMISNTRSLNDTLFIKIRMKEVSTTTVQAVRSGLGRAIVVHNNVMKALGEELVPTRIKISSDAVSPEILCIQLLPEEFSSNPTFEILN